MIVFPFEKVTDVPTGLGGNAEIAASSDLIEVMDRFSFQTLRATNKSYFRGVSGYLFDAQILIGFGKDYKISDLEIRHPFSCLKGEGIYWRNLNLVHATLSDLQAVFRKEGVVMKSSEVGFDAPDLGISFFSNDYENSLDVRMDAITVHFRQ